ncbi:MAG: hypothetical protein PVH19_10835 [Planctomycetia bacterium]|jgi:endoglucanase
MPITKRELNLLKNIASAPTAPFCEMVPLARVKAWAEKNQIECREDKFGNLLLKYPGTEKVRDPWVLQAHLDHPSFGVVKQQGRTVHAQFRGSVLPKFFKGESVRFFPELIGHPKPNKMQDLSDGSDKFASVTGTILSAKLDKKTRFLNCRIKLDRLPEEPLQPGTLGMWNLPAWRQSGDKLSLRACDDLVGAAAVLTTIERLKRTGAKRPVYGLLTRAEELGFVGALAAAQLGTIKKSWPVLGIETSKAQAAAPIGGGAVIRVGDKKAVFSPSLNMHLDEAAAKVTKRKGIQVVRSLMPGGSTESTLLATVGYRTCATCIPLGNYHNMGKDKIRVEQVNLSDYASLISLLVVASQSTPNDTPSKKFAEQIDAHCKAVIKAASF